GDQERGASVSVRRRHAARLAAGGEAGARLAPMSAAEHRITVVGAGMAGSEAALAAAREGVRVDLYEMRPTKLTPAHATGHFAEMVCSNSFGGEGRSNAKGLLQAEMLRAGGVVMGSAVARSEERRVGKECA